MLVKEDFLRLEWENPVILLKRARHVATNGQLHVELQRLAILGRRDFAYHIYLVTTGAVENRCESVTPAAYTEQNTPEGKPTEVRQRFGPPYTDPREPRSDAVPHNRHRPGTDGIV